VEKKLRKDDQPIQGIVFKLIQLEIDLDDLDIPPKQTDFIWDTIKANENEVINGKNAYFHVFFVYAIGNN
jgi:hypothetical protein